MTPPVPARRAALPRFDAPSYGLASILIAAVALSAGTLEAAAGSEQSQRMAAAFLGPLLLLAGMHARLEGFVHARARRALLSLPVPATRHWADAQRSRRLGLALGLLAGMIALGITAATGELHRPWVTITEFAWLGLFAWILEPLVPAWSAFLGRRFDESSPQGRAQVALGGGWTAPEAVVHLYAPALGVLGATALAMPGQLSIERAFEGLPLQAPHLALGLAPLALALWLRREALERYGAGMFEAVAWLEQAERSLSGEQAARSRPWIAKLARDPWARLRLIAVWRRVPGASVRALAAAVLPWAFVVAGRAPGGLAVALCAATTLAWVGPLLRLHDPGEEAQWARFGAELPLVHAGRGRLPARVFALLTTPIAMGLCGLLVAWRMHG